MNPRPAFLARLSRLATFSHKLVAGFVVLNALVLALLLVSLERNRENHRNRAGVATQNIAQLIEQNLSASLQRADHALLSVADELERETDAGGIDRQVLSDFFVRAYSRQADFDSLEVADEHGQVIGAAGFSPIPQANAVERDFFRKLRDGPRGATSLFRSTSGKSAEETGLVIARRIEHRTGDFGGVIYAVLGADRLHKTFAGIDLGSNGLVAIRDLEFGLLVRQPQLASTDATSDPRAISGAFRQALLANPDSGTFTSKNGFDGIERTNSYRKLPGFSCYVIVGLATEDYLLGWRRESLPTLALGASFALLTFVLSEQLRRLWTRREAAIAMLAKQEAKFRKILEGAPDALVITDSNGCIRMINQRTETMFGYSRGELLGQNVEILMPERYRNAHAAMVCRFSAQPQTRRMGLGRTLVAVSKEGREFPVNISLSPIETEEGILITADIRDMAGTA